MLSQLKTPRWSTATLGIAALLAAAGSFFVARLAATAPPAGAPVAAAFSRLPKTESLASAKKWDDAWQSAARLPACPSRNRKLEEMIELLARTDPQRALALALSESNWLLRDQLRNAALRGWGATAPDAAADWSMARTDLAERMFCVASVLAGAAEKPDNAVRVGLRVCAADPAPAGDYGHALVNALVEKTGSFEAATRFALSATMVDRQSYLVDSAFYQWAQHEPALAVGKLSEIKDPALRASVTKGIVAGWADADAKALATYAQNMPSGEDRTQFMSIALTQWARKSPEETMQWMNQFEPHPDFDKGFATVALGEQLLKNRPEMAIEMTEYITDQAQRTLTRDNAFWRWALRDPDGARKYAESVQNPEYRSSMLDDLTRLPPDAGSAR